MGKRSHAHEGLGHPSPTQKCHVRRQCVRCKSRDGSAAIALSTMLSYNHVFRLTVVFKQCLAPSEFEKNKTASKS